MRHGRGQNNQKIKHPISKVFLETNYEHYLEDSAGDVFRVISAKDWVNHFLVDKQRGFRPERIRFLILRKITQGLLRLFKKIAREELYVKIAGRGFYSLKIELRFQKIIEELIKDGIVSNFFRMRFRPDWPRIPYYRFGLRPIPRPDGTKTFLTGSLSGSGFNSNDALVTALAETLERYSLCVWNPKKIITGSFNSLRKRGVIDPALFRVLSEKQLLDGEMHAKHTFNSDTIFGWTEVVSLSTAKKHLAPAQLVFIPWLETNREPLIRHTTTNGAGAGESWQRATYAAICENVERDALVIFWLNRITPPQIDLNSINNGLIQGVLEQFRRYNIEIKILELTTDINLPVFAAVYIDRSRMGPAVALSGSADLNPERAILRALLEGARIGPAAMSFLTPENARKANLSYPNFDSISSRALWWSQPKAIKEIEWLLNGPIRKFEKNPPEEKDYKKKLAAVRKLFMQAKQEVYIADVTSPLARKYGLWVVMSLIPGFCHFYLNEKLRPLGVKRLYELPVRLGYLKSPKKEEEMNQVPHPLP